jgi:MarR family transcriptional regulator, organic hydroperoxide resistance regulator
MQDLVRDLMTYYPQIYFACHTRHVRDSRAGRVLSANQASVLDHLDELEPTNLRTLAAHMGVTASTMSIAVDRLVRQGYVVRRKDAQDGRQVKLLLTRAGVRIKSEKSVLDPQLVRNVLSKLAPAERREALRGLALLAQASHRAMRERGAGSKFKRSDA